MRFWYFVVHFNWKTSTLSCAFYPGSCCLWYVMRVKLPVCFWNSPAHGQSRGVWYSAAFCLSLFFPSALISWVSHKEPVPRLRTHCCANTPGLTSSLECFIWRQIKEEAGEVGVSSYCLRSFRCHHFLYLKDSVMESFGASSQTNPARRVYRSQITVFTFLRFCSCVVLEGFTLDRCKSSEILFSSDVLQIKKNKITCNHIWARKTVNLSIRSCIIMKGLFCDDDQKWLLKK